MRGGWGQGPSRAPGACHPERRESLRGPVGKRERGDGAFGANGYGGGQSTGESRQDVLQPPAADDLGADRRDILASDARGVGSFRGARVFQSACAGCALSASWSRPSSQPTACLACGCTGFQPGKMRAHPVLRPAHQRSGSGSCGTPCASAFGLGQQLVNPGANPGGAGCLHLKLAEQVDAIEPARDGDERGAPGPAPVQPTTGTRRACRP